MVSLFAARIKRLRVLSLQNCGVIFVRPFLNKMISWTASSATTKSE